MENLLPTKIVSITDFHRLRGLNPPLHPLISIIDYDLIQHRPNEGAYMCGFYTIALKREVAGKIRYGQSEYDFDEGVIFFAAPNQVFKVEIDEVSSPKGWMLLIHPDFLWNTALAAGISKFDFFHYDVNEALFLSEKEETTLLLAIENIESEINGNIDRFSKNIIITQIEGLLNYCDRFYHRQFITREKANHQLLHRLEVLLDDYFNSQEVVLHGIPEVKEVAKRLNVSPSYLGNLLRTLTGKNTRQHIQDKILERAKEKLSTTDLTVSEIAYELGFEHLQSFSKFFKTKTNQSPIQFKNSFL